MIWLSLALFGVVSPGWALQDEVPFESDPIVTTIATFANGTGSGMNYSGPLYATRTLIQRVTGSANDGPPWPNWLKPLSSLEDDITTTHPSPSPKWIPAGQSLYVKYQYDLETGSQTYVFTSPLIAATRVSAPLKSPPPVERSRYWMANGFVFEVVN